jgi:colicin import membrane protein
VKVTLCRIKYYYDERPNKTTLYAAEELIIDKEAMNKARTKLVRPGAKFRRKTIDRKDEVFNRIKDCLLKNNG